MIIAYVCNNNSNYSTNRNILLVTAATHIAPSLLFNNLDVNFLTGQYLMLN